MAPSFLIRIELHKPKASDDDYNTLHEAMKNAGFSRTIKNDNTGLTFRLPTAEYSRIGAELTVKKVFAEAKAAASSTKLKYWILVAEYVSLECVLDEV